MNRSKIALGILVAILLFLIARPIIREIQKVSLFHEADRVQPAVWRLAIELENFKQERGQLPKIIAELPDSDGAFHSFTNFDHTYTPAGTNVFWMSVNKRFSFVISSNLIPRWDVNFDF